MKPGENVLDELVSNEQEKNDLKAESTTADMYTKKEFIMFSARYLIGL